MFDFFDPAGELRITAGNLPHWYQPGATYFVTFRTEDSLPKAAADLWYRRRSDWLSRHGIRPNEVNWARAIESLPENARREYHQTFSMDYLEQLDKGHGECLLRERRFSELVASSLRHFNGGRYHLGDFVVMPNHVHLIVGLLGNTDIEQQCTSWKKFTAGEINRALQRKGRFWQEESFDHLIRNPDSFERLQNYIANNGPKAGLRPMDYLHWRRPQ